MTTTGGLGLRFQANPLGLLSAFGRPVVFQLAEASQTATASLRSGRQFAAPRLFQS
jgi:hypothetical protein